jgi:hypothetical protein
MRRTSEYKGSSKFNSLEMLRVAMGSESSIRKTLDALDLPKSVYYRWRHKAYDEYFYFLHKIFLLLL